MLQTTATIWCELRVTAAVLPTKLKLLNATLSYDQAVLTFELSNSSTK